MKKVYAVFCLLMIFFSNAQNLEKLADEITEEGILLYRSEMASWYGTDVFLANYPDRENIGGYFSYISDDVPKCVFYSKTNKVIGMVSFPTNYEPANSKLDLTEREFSELEKDYFDLRTKAAERAEIDSTFTYYNNTSFNFVPLITENEKKVYVLTGTNVQNVVIFGNDYLIEFNKENEIKKVQRLHKSIIVQNIVDEEVGKTVSATHSHVLEDWPFITPTDICTLMLYQKFTDWESYNVISREFTSLFNPKSNKLIIMKTDVIRKINEDQEKRKKARAEKK